MTFDSCSVLWFPRIRIFKNKMTQTSKSNFKISSFCTLFWLIKSLSELPSVSFPVIFFFDNFFDSLRTLSFDLMIERLMFPSSGTSRKGLVCDEDVEPSLDPILESSVSLPVSLSSIFSSLMNSVLILANLATDPKLRFSRSTLVRTTPYAQSG